MPIPSICKEYLSNFFPSKELKTKISPEIQVENYNTRIRNDKIIKNMWIPVPACEDMLWNLEEVKRHITNGSPFYIRSMHHEDELYSYNGYGIYPARVCYNDYNRYDPDVILEHIYKYRYCCLPEEIRFADETSNLNTCEEIFTHAIKVYKEIYPLSVIDINLILWLIIKEFLNLHGASSTRCTPFKGMIGGTINDKIFIKEMDAIISSYGNDTVIIVVDKYGRFIHNGFNMHQKREFLALGGICESEIVYTMSSHEYKELISTLVI